MNAFDQNFYEKFKKREEQQNRVIKDLLNSPHFVDNMSVMLEMHLDRIQMQRVVVHDLIKIGGYLTKDEIATIARSIIKREARIDELEDLVFQFVNICMTNQNRISELKGSMVNMRFSLKEHSNSESNRLNDLKEELEQVKSLFI